MQDREQAIEYERRFSSLENRADNFDSDRDEMKALLADHAKRLGVLERCVWIVTGAVALVELLVRLGAFKGVT